MANTNTSDESAAGTLTGTELFRIVQSGGNKKVDLDALRAYIIGSADALVYKGVTDCSANPNYPAADAGHVYLVSVAGKIGGASGTVVEVGDLFLCRVDSTASGNQATVGSSWNVVQANMLAPFASPTTTKGDLIVRGASADGRLAVGANGQGLVADSAQALGVKWDTIAGGGSNGTDYSARGITGANPYASGKFSSAGDAQRNEYVLRMSSSGTAAVSMTTDGAAIAAASNNYVVVPSNGHVAFKAIVLIAGDSNQDAMYEVKGLARKGGSIGSAVFVGTPTVTQLFAQGATAYGVAVSLNYDFSGNNDYIDFQYNCGQTNNRAVANVLTVENVH